MNLTVCKKDYYEIGKNLNAHAIEKLAEDEIFNIGSYLEISDLFDLFGVNRAFQNASKKCFKVIYGDKYRLICDEGIKSIKKGLISRSFALFNALPITIAENARFSLFAEISDFGCNLQNKIDDLDEIKDVENNKKIIEKIEKLYFIHNKLHEDGADLIKEYISANVGINSALSSSAGVLVDHLIQQGNYDEAITSAEKYQNDESLRIIDFITIAKALISEGSISKALEVFLQKVKDSDVNNAGCQTEYLIIFSEELMESGCIDDAILWAEKIKDEEKKKEMMDKILDNVNKNSDELEKMD